jgi:hypothetical protein
MTDLFTWIERPRLSSPALVVMLNGWIDAGSAAATAMDVLLNESAARTIGVFDGDTFIDYRARRPVMELRDGVNTKLIWPTIEVRLGRDVAGHDVLLLTGHEPDSGWRLFCDATTEIALDLGVRMVVGLGAYPYGAPHTRPSRLSITAGSTELAASLPYLKNTVDVPAGMGAALEERFTLAGVPAVGLWAQVPHYVANLPYPGASVALLGGLHEMTGVATEGVAEARRPGPPPASRRPDAQNQEHVAMLQQLETVSDAEVSPGSAGPPRDLPTGDETLPNSSATPHQGPDIVLGRLADRPADKASTVPSPIGRTFSNTVYSTPPHCGDRTSAGDGGPAKRFRGTGPAISAAVHTAYTAANAGPLPGPPVWRPSAALPGTEHGSRYEPILTRVQFVWPGFRRSDLASWGARQYVPRHEGRRRNR